MRMQLPKLSLILNVLALVPICTALILDADRITRAYGPATEGRAVLLSIYLSILAMSLVLLKRPDARMISALLAVQVIYKVTTPFTVGTLANPAVISNLAIAALHSVTLWYLLRSQPSETKFNP